MAQPALARCVLGLAVALSHVGGCGERALTDGEDATDDVMDDIDVGERPTNPGSVYSACTDTSACSPLEFCVFPAGEAGFCTSACGQDEDTSSCAEPPGDTRSPICMDIGLPDARTVCAVSCDGVSCPDGMRCEEVEAAGSAVFACF